MLNERIDETSFGFFLSFRYSDAKQNNGTPCISIILTKLEVPPDKLQWTHMFPLIRVAGPEDHFLRSSLSRPMF
jgi:hypothetical protein